MAPLFVCHRAASHSSVAIGSSRKWGIDKGTFFTLRLHSHCVALLPCLEDAAGERDKGKGK